MMPIFKRGQLSEHRTGKWAVMPLHQHVKQCVHCSIAGAILRLVLVCSLSTCAGIYMFTRMQCHIHNVQ